MTALEGVYLASARDQYTRKGRSSNLETETWIAQSQLRFQWVKYGNQPDGRWFPFTTLIERAEFNKITSRKSVGGVRANDTLQFFTPHKGFCFKNLNRSRWLNSETRPWDTNPAGERDRRTRDSVTQVFFSPLATRFVAYSIVHFPRSCSRHV